MLVQQVIEREGAGGGDQGDRRASKKFGEGGRVVTVRTGRELETIVKERKREVAAILSDLGRQTVTWGGTNQTALHGPIMVAMEQNRTTNGTQNEWES